ncbi:DegV family protein [Enterococcus gallinarum]|nr:DegV family protein [Enterococcus gallinarum]
MIALYETLAQKGYDTILSIHLSSGISGFINTLYGIKDDIKGARVIPMILKSPACQWDIW